MTRFACSIALIACLAFAFAFAAPASATGIPTARVTGAVTGDAPFTFSTNGCAFVHQVYSVDVDTRGPSAHLVIDVCVDLPNEPGPAFPANGTFTLTTAGGTLVGDAQGEIGGNIPDALAFTLTITGGTRGFAHAQGTLTLTGEWDSQINEGIQNGPVTGQLS